MFLATRVSREQTPLLRSLFPKLPMLALAIPTLSNGLFPGVTDRQALSLFHPDLARHVSIHLLSSPMAS